MPRAHPGQQETQPLLLSTSCRGQHRMYLDYLMVDSHTCRRTIGEATFDSGSAPCRIPERDPLPTPALARAMLMVAWALRRTVPKHEVSRPTLGSRSNQAPSLNPHCAPMPKGLRRIAGRHLVPDRLSLSADFQTTTSCSTRATSSSSGIPMCWIQVHCAEASFACTVAPCAGATFARTS